MHSYGHPQGDAHTSAYRSYPSPGRTNSNYRNAPRKDMACHSAMMKNPSHKRAAVATRNNLYWCAPEQELTMLR